MEALLVELADFLSPQNRPDVRAQAAEHVKALAVSNDLAPFASTVDAAIVPALIKLTGDVAAVSKPVIDALVNLSAAGLFLPSSPAVASRASFWRWLVAEPSELLVNLTSHPAGPLKVDAHVIGGASRAVMDLVAHAHAHADNNAARVCLQAVRNLTTVEAAQSALVQSSAALAYLLNALLSANAAVSQAAAGALRNCAIENDLAKHAQLLKRDAGGYLAAALLLHVGAIDVRSALDDERHERVGMSPVLLRVFAGELKPHACPDVETRSLAVDCLARLATSRSGRALLRQSQVYPALRTYHLHERDEAVSEKVFGVVDLLLLEGEDDAAEDATFALD